MIEDIVIVTVGYSIGRTLMGVFENAYRLYKSDLQVLRKSFPRRVLDLLKYIKHVLILKY